MQRPTILDIARAAGVSKSAVSYALNGRPGVSAATRSRIVHIAEELGWVPSSAARALSSARADAVGLVAARSPELLATEPYFMRVMAGIENAVAGRGTALLLTTVADEDTELYTYRRWWAGRRVDGVLLLDMRTHDPRPALLRELGVPAVVMGAQRRYPELCAAIVNDDDAMLRAVGHLIEAGHRRIARVSGPVTLEHAAARTRYFDEACRSLLGAEQVQVETDYTAREGLAATHRLLAADPPPTAIIYDNDVMAAAAVSDLVSRGVRVPAEVAVLAWDDSPLCELVRPAVTAFNHDVAAEAEVAAGLLLDCIDERGGLPAERLLAPRTLEVRGSTVDGK